MANTYLGSVEWGWSVDAKGDATLGPDPIGLVRAGAPTEQFMKAAKRWNAAKLKDPSTGKEHETVDLPLTSLDSGSVAASSRATPDLVKRIAKVKDEIKGLKAGVDRTNKEFEKRVLEAELATRPDRPAAAAPKGK
jgi:hypothetical protein